VNQKELRSAGFIVIGGLVLGLAVRLLMTGDIIPGVLAAAATVALIVFGRRRAKEEQGEEALKAAEEYDRLHAEGADGEVREGGTDRDGP
jgi:hypothetical protein